MPPHDLLSDWLHLREQEIPLEVLARCQAQTRAALRRLEKFLSNGSAHSAEVVMMSQAFARPGGLPLEDVAYVHDLYRRVVKAGAGCTDALEEPLLQLVADTEAAVSIPFWLEILDLVCAGDRFAARRRDMALAALACMAIGRQSPGAYDALGRAAHHGEKEVRALALHYLRRAYAEVGRVPPGHVCDDLLDIALSDEWFAPRYQARLALQAVDLPLPVDNLGGAYRVAVSSDPGGGDGHKVEVRSEQTLDDLHLAIQHALDWDAGGRYSFHMRGRPWDGDYTIPCPEGREGVRHTDETLIGELGLELGQRFLYVFDHQEEARCQIEVVDIVPEAEPGESPRIIDVRGHLAPPYRPWNPRD
jgi:hypothetical protein